LVAASQATLATEDAASQAFTAALPEGRPRSASADGTAGGAP